MAGPGDGKEIVVVLTGLFAGLTFRGWFPLWMAVVLGVLAAAAVVFVYLREAGRLPMPVRLFLAALRACTLGVILFLVLKPVLTSEKTEERRKSVLVVVDDTESMKTKDSRTTYEDQWRLGVALSRIPHDKEMPEKLSPSHIPDEMPEKGVSRLEIAKKLLEHPELKLLDALEKTGPVQPATFGKRLNVKDSGNRKWVENLAGGEDSTAMIDSLLQALKRGDNDLPTAIVLMTDGLDKASERGLSDLIRECQKRQVPVHVVGIGTSSSSQLELRETAMPDTIYVDDTIKVPFRWRMKGGKGKVMLTVLLNGVKVAEKDFDATDGDDLRETLSFVPAKEQAGRGRQELTTIVSVTNGNEVMTDKITRGVRVVDQKVKVLYVEGMPRWDFKFLMKSLLRDRRVEASFYLFDSDPRAMRSGAPFIPTFPMTAGDLFKFDLLILGDVDAKLLSREQQEMVREFVSQGGGLITIAGKYAGPASFVGTPIAEVMPVEFDAVKPPSESNNRPAGFRPVLTPEGMRSPMLMLDDVAADNLRTWAELPELFWFYPVKKLKIGAESLLEHPKDTLPDGKPVPLVASGYFGRGLVTFIAFDETWRWRYNEADTFFGRFWSQTVYVNGVPRTMGSKQTQLLLDTQEPLLGRTGRLYAKLMTREFRPVTTPKLLGRAKWLDAPPEATEREFPVELKALPDQPGQYVATVPFGAIGRYTITVDNDLDKATLDYRVGYGPDHELAPGTLQMNELKKLAKETGGGFYREETISTLASKLEAKTVTETRPVTEVLWNWISLVVVICLFTLEWVIRKFFSLS